MPTVEKIIKKMQRQPNGITIAEIEKVLKSRDIYLNNITGSHYGFKSTDKTKKITIPVHKNIKSIYIKQVLEIIKED